MQDRHDNIKLIDNQAKIVPSALNIGIAAAKGDVIIRVDGHAWLDRDYLNQCVKYLQITKADCVGGPIESVNNTFIGKAIALAMSSPFGVGNAKFRYTKEEGYVDTNAFGAYQKEVFEKVGLFDEQLVRCQDDEFNYRLRKFGGRIFLTPKIRSYYYPRSSLKKLWQQYFQYGFWKVRVLQKHFAMMQPRQFVPPLFVLSLVGAGVLGLFFNTINQLFILIFISYFLASTFTSSRICLKQGWQYFPVLPICFGILHFGYGIGFLIGLIKFWRYWKS